MELKNIEKIKNDIIDIKKPFLMFEGESDSIIFSTAYKQLKNISISDKWNLCGYIKNEKSAVIGCGAIALNNFLYNHIGRIPVNNIIIGIFDFDQTGVSEIKALKKVFDNISDKFNGSIVFRHKQKKNVFAVTLKPPNFRASFVDFNNEKYCYLSTELLLEDNYIDESNREYPSKNDKSVYSFKGDKIQFARKIKDNYLNYKFDGFMETINLLEEIIRSSS